MDEAIECAKQAAIQADDLWDHHAYAVWIAKAVAEEAARQAAEQMQERAWCAAVGAFRPKDKSDDYCDGYFQGRKEAGDSVLALTLEE